MKSRIKNALPKLGLWVVLLALSSFATAQNAPLFTGIERQSNGEILLKLNAPAGVNYRIDAASNLPDWISLVTLKSAGLVQHTDSAGPYFGSRFYRVLPLTDAEAFVGDHIPTVDGDLIVRPINHASFVMMWKGMMIYNDPVGGASLYNGIPRANLVLVSHSHSDHYDNGTLASVRGTDGMIIAPQAVYNGLTSALKAAATVMVNGDKKDLMGINIEAIPAYNSNHPKGTGNGYVLTIGGKRLYMSGDTGDIPEMRALANIDVAFLCINTPYTMTLAQAVSAAREFRPKVVYPYHFRNSDNTLTDLNSFKRQVGTDVGVEVRARKWY